jgi:hypothetical protein
MLAFALSLVVLLAFAPMALGSSAVGGKSISPGQRTTTQYAEPTIAPSPPPLIQKTGLAGENVTYRLDMETGVLEIDGTGPMYDWCLGEITDIL